MDDDLIPVAAVDSDDRLRLTLPKGNQQMRLSAQAYRWLREAKSLVPEASLTITVAQVKDSERIAIVYDPGGLTVDPGNYYCSGAGLRRLLGHPKERVDIPLTPNAEKGRLEGVLPSPQAGGAPADVKKSPSAGSEPRKGADEQVAPRPTKKHQREAQAVAETGKASERRATVAACPQCGTEAPQQGTLYDYAQKPPVISALVFSCSNGHRFETKPVMPEDATTQGIMPHVVSDLTDEDVNAIDAILAEDAASDAENDDEVNPEWLAALREGETHDDAR